MLKKLIVTYGLLNVGLVLANSTPSIDDYMVDPDDKNRSAEMAAEIEAKYGGGSKENQENLELMDSIRGQNFIKSISDDGTSFELNVPDWVANNEDNGIDGNVDCSANPDSPLCFQHDDTGYGASDADPDKLRDGYSDRPIYVNAFGRVGKSMTGQTGDAQSDAITLSQSTADGKVDAAGNSIATSPEYILQQGFLNASREALKDESISQFGNAMFGTDGDSCEYKTNLVPGDQTRRIPLLETCSRAVDPSGDYTLDQLVDAGLIEFVSTNGKIANYQANDALIALAPGDTRLVVGDFEEYWSDPGNDSTCTNTTHSVTYRFDPQTMATAINDFRMTNVIYEDGVLVEAVYGSKVVELYSAAAPTPSGSPNTSGASLSPRSASCDTDRRSSSDSATLSPTGTCDSGLVWSQRRTWSCVEEKYCTSGTLNSGRCETITSGSKCGNKATTTETGCSVKNIASGTCSYNASHSSPGVNYDWTKTCSKSTSTRQVVSNSRLGSPTFSNVSTETSVPLNIPLNSILNEMVEAGETSLTLLVTTISGRSGKAEASFKINYDVNEAVFLNNWEDNEATKNIITQATGDFAEFKDGDDGFTCALEYETGPFPNNSGSGIIEFADRGVLIPYSVLSEEDWMTAVLGSGTQSETLNNIKACQTIAASVRYTYFRSDDGNGNSVTVERPKRTPDGQYITDANGEIIMETVVIDTSDTTVTNQCETMKANGCLETGETRCAAGGTDPITGVCLVAVEVLDCGYDVPIAEAADPGYLECNGATIPCVGDACTDKETNNNFSNMAGLLQAAESIAASSECASSDPESCVLWAGEAASCKRVLTGSETGDNWIGQNCCYFKDDDGLGRFTKGFKAMLQVKKLDDGKKAITEAEESGELSEYLGLQSADQETDITYTEIDGRLVDQADNVTGRTDDSDQSQVNDEVEEHIGERIDGLLSSIFGEDYGDVIVGAGLNIAWGVSKEAIKEAGTQQLANLVGQQLAGNIVGSIGGVTTALMLTELAIEIIFACEPEEVQLYSDKQAQMCSYVGTQCDSKILGICTKTSDVYCCYNDPLARIIAEGIRKDGAAPGLGDAYQSFGTTEAPRCEGITVQDIAAIDFNKVDLKGWIDLMVTMEATVDVENVTLANLTGSGSDFNFNNEIVVNNANKREIATRPDVPEIGLQCEAEYLAIKNASEDPLGRAQILQQMSPTCQTWSTGNACMGYLQELEFCAATRETIQYCQAATVSETGVSYMLPGSAGGCYELQTALCAGVAVTGLDYCQLDIDQKIKDAQADACTDISEAETALCQAVVGN